MRGGAICPDSRPIRPNRQIIVVIPLFFTHFSDLRPNTFYNKTAILEITGPGVLLFFPNDFSLGFCNFKYVGGGNRADPPPIRPKSGIIPIVSRSIGRRCSERALVESAIRAGRTRTQRGATPSR